MLKQDDAEGKKRNPGDVTLLNLAEGLVALLADTSEYCTPGHRMGHGYHLFMADLTADVGTGHYHIDTFEPGVPGAARLR